MLLSTALEIKPRLWPGQAPPHQLNSSPVGPFLTKQQHKQATPLVLGIFVAWREVKQPRNKYLILLGEEVMGKPGCMRREDSEAAAGGAGLCFVTGMPRKISLIGDIWPEI